MTTTPAAAAPRSPSTVAGRAGTASAPMGDAELPVTDELLRRLRESGL